MLHGAKGSEARAMERYLISESVQSPHGHSSTFCRHVVRHLSATVLDHVASHPVSRIPCSRDGRVSAIVVHPIPASKVSAAIFQEPYARWLFVHHSPLEGSGRRRTEETTSGSGCHVRPQEDVAQAPYGEQVPTGSSTCCSCHPVGILCLAC